MHEMHEQQCQDYKFCQSATGPSGQFSDQNCFFVNEILLRKYNLLGLFSAN